MRRCACRTYTKPCRKKTWCRQRISSMPLMSRPSCLWPARPITASTWSARRARIQLGRPRSRVPTQRRNSQSTGRSAWFAALRAWHRPPGTTVSMSRASLITGSAFQSPRAALVTPGRCAPKPHRRRASSRCIPQAQHEALCAARQRLGSEEGWTLYARRAGIEGTLSQAVRAFGLRRTRYRGLAKQACSMWRRPSP